jgi:hypothetical protein
MPHQPLAVCLFCRRPLAPGELTVFRDEVKIAHVRCWRLDHRSVGARAEARPDAT